MFGADPIAPGKGKSLPPWGVKVGPDEDRVIQKPGKAEEELQSAIEQGKWNELAGKTRLWLLRNFAIDHNQWTEFTPRCQMWVLHELGRLLAEERKEIPTHVLTHKEALTARIVEKDRGHLLTALEKTRLPSIVGADPQRARDLSAICEAHLALGKAANLLQGELDNQAMHKRLQAVHSVTLPRVSSPALPRSKSDAGLKSLTSSSGRDRGAAAREKKHATRSTSEASLQRSRGATNKSVKLERTLQPEELEKTTSAASVAARRSSKIVTGQLAASRRASMAMAMPPPEPVEKKEENKKAIDPDAPRVLRVVEEGKDPSSPIQFQSWSLVPKKSKAWRKVVEEEERQKVKSAMLRKTYEYVLVRADLLQSVLTARVMVHIPPSAPHISSMKKAVTPYGVEFMELQRREGREGEERVVYELRIPTLVSVNFVTDLVAQAYKNLKDWEIEPRWAYHVAAAELALAYPDYELSPEDLEEIFGSIVNESCSQYSFAWEAIKRQDPREDVDKLFSLPSKSIFEGLLLSEEDGLSRNLREERLLNEADNLEDMMEDARIMQRHLKRLLGPRTPWARAELNDLSEVPEGDDRRSWRADAKQPNGLIAEGLVPGGLCYDPGILSVEAVKDLAKANFRPYESDLPLKEAIGIPCIEIAFETLTMLTTSLKRLQDCRAFEVVTIVNNFRNPSCLGHRYISLVVRMQVPLGDEPEPPTPEPESEIELGEDDAVNGGAGGEEGVDAAATEEGPTPTLADAEDLGFAETTTTLLPDAEEEAANEPEQEKEVPTGPRRAHVGEIRLTHQGLQNIARGSGRDLRSSISERLSSYGVEPGHLEPVQDLILSALDMTDGRLPRGHAIEFRRLISHVRHLCMTHPVLKEQDLELSKEIVAEMAAQVFEVGRATWGEPANVEEAIHLVGIREAEAEQLDAQQRRRAKAEDDQLRKKQQEEDE